jgi:hypothetical protein
MKNRDEFFKMEGFIGMTVFHLTKAKVSKTVRSKCPTVEIDKINTDLSAAAYLRNSCLKRKIVITYSAVPRKPDSTLRILRQN